MKIEVILSEVEIEEAFVCFLAKRLNIKCELIVISELYPSSGRVSLEILEDESGSK